MKGENEMKKILFAIVFVTMMTFGANSQCDGFFNDYQYSCDRDDLSNIVLPSGAAMGSDPTPGNPSAPLGSGLLVLTTLGAGYALNKSRGK
jgi:hypothetical protein